MREGRTPRGGSTPRNRGWDEYQQMLDSQTVRPEAERSTDPVSFVEETLGEEPYEKQTDILDAVARSRRVSVVGCHGSGKDWAAARAVLWWLHSRSPAKAIVTGPTTRQVDDILWREIRTAHAGAAHRLRGRVFRTSRYEIDDQTFAIGFATSSPYNLQGFHSPNLMVVVTEAHAVPGTDIDALRRLNPALTLMTGNPLVSAGPFYDSHHSKRAMYDTVRIGADDIPNLTRLAVPGMVAPEHVADRKAEWGRSDAMYVGGVLGRFPDNLDDAVVRLRDATDAAERSLQPAGDVVVACDVSRFGQAKTVVVRRQGPVARIVWRVRGRDTMSIAEFLESYCDRERVDTLVVDDSGVGGGVVDRLRQLRLPHTRLVPFVGGKKARNSDRFANLITEAWFAMKRRYDEGTLDTDDDPALIAQVSSRMYHQPRDAAIALVSKDGKRDSPDEADALAMTFAAPRRGFKIWL